MYAPQFIRNLYNIIKQVRTTKGASYINDKNLKGVERAQIELEFLKLMMQHAQYMGELEIKGKEVAINLARAKLEAESNLVLNKVNLLNAMAQNLRAQIECFTLKQSVIDNAYINRANILTIIANIAANGQNLAGATQDIKDAKEFAKKIGEQVETGFDDILSDIKNRSEEVFKYGNGAKDVIIIASKTLIAPNEQTTLIGLSIFGHNPARFELEDRTILSTGGEATFSAQEAGEYEISYIVRDNDNNEVRDSITITIKDQEEGV